MKVVAFAVGVAVLYAAGVSLVAAGALVALAHVLVHRHSSTPRGDHGASAVETTPDDQVNAPHEPGACGRRHCRHCESHFPEVGG